MAGESILANIVSEILKKLGSFALEEINLAQGVRKELVKLQQTVLMIEAVISDAENKQVKEKSVGIWLKELRDLAYDADDILDEYAYDLMHQRGLNRKRDKVRNFISISSNPIARSSKMGHEIKDLNQKFDELARQRIGLGLQTIVVGSSHTMGVDGSHGINRETYAFVDESKVLGREVDKSKIINMLLSNKSPSNKNEKISVIPIVGMGGLGKTTLAQLVYKDTVVERHFELRIWVCVSYVFDVKKLFINIIESIPGDKFDDVSNLNVIVEILQKRLKGKKFLLVLDDVWNEKDGEWNKLKDPLLVGAEGSKIVVTTRSENVASIVLAGEFPSYKLQTLGEGICLSIFEQRAFGPLCKAIKTPTLVEIGKELVRKCGGLPLAAKALGSLMHSKKEVSEWEVIRDSRIWDNISEYPNKILPALKLSYDHLSPQVKQCFSYCSLFPKDSNIERETIIKLWMAEGFIQPSQGDNRLTEEIGNEYFHSLLWNSFFQGVNTNRSGEIANFKMHDLIHDLAESVAGTHECLVMEVSKMGDVSQFRRLNLPNVNDESSTVVSKLLTISKSKLRTLFVSMGGVKDIANYLIDNNKRLRVLDLSYTDIEEIPPSIGDLKHLRYLDLSDCWYLKELPEAITRLYNLQTLRLDNCWNLKKIPKDLNKLINLRHLWHGDVNDWQDQLGQLTSLQTLNGFKAIRGSCVGGGIRLLQCLNLLKGKFEITGLDRMISRENAETANLIAKKYIQQLSLRWGHEDKDSDERWGEEEEYSNHSLVLEGLQPHPNLRTLKIFDFMGPNFPTWMSSNPSSCLRNLVKLKLYGCNRCKQLPALGLLPSLRFLEIRSMLLLEEWLDQPLPLSIVSSSSSSSSSSSCSSYSSLESIKISGCPKLKSMGVSSTMRSYLDTFTKLSLWDVDGLTTPQPRSSHQDLLLSNSNSNSNSSSSSSSSSLRELDLRNCPVLRLFPGDIRGLTSLQKLTIDGCGKLNVDCVSNLMMDTLTSLSLSSIPGLIFLPLGLLKGNNVLQTLIISYCPDFQGFIQEVEGFKASPFTLNSLVDEDLSLSSSNSNSNSSSSSLRELELRNCPVLKLLPGDIRGLTSLQKLTIDGCLKLNVNHCDINLMDSLTSLWLSNIPGLKFLPLGLLKGNNVLQTLFINYCLNFQGFIQEVEGDKDLSLSNSCSSSLRELYLRDCPALRLLPYLRDLTSLQDVTIEGCNKQLVIVLPNGVKKRLKS